MLNFLLLLVGLAVQILRLENRLLKLQVLWMLQWVDVLLPPDDRLLLCLMLLLLQVQQQWIGCCL